MKVLTRTAGTCASAGEVPGRQPERSALDEDLMAFGLTYTLRRRRSWERKVRTTDLKKSSWERKVRTTDLRKSSSERIPRCRDLEKSSWERKVRSVDLGEELFGAQSEVS
jgi:hypothetical protein